MRDGHNCILMKAQEKVHREESGELMDKDKRKDYLKYLNFSGSTWGSFGTAL